jgi:hypothetical protein
VRTKPISDALMQAVTPLLQHVRMDLDRGRAFLEGFQYIVNARPQPDIEEPFSDTPITFVACVNDEDQLNSNLLRSPCLAPGTPHQVILQVRQTSAAQGFNDGIDRAEHDLVVFVQQDMYLPRGWDTQFTRAWAQAAEKFAPLGAAGLFGLTYRDGEPEHVGRAVDRDRLLDLPTCLPALVDGLDEILLAVPRNTPFRFDERLGFHAYGADLCLTLRKLGLSTVVLDAPAYHNSLFARVDSAFHESRAALLAKWPEPRPIYSNMGRLDTMTSVVAPGPAPTVVPAVQHHEALQARDRKIAALRKQLDASRARIQRMEASPFWRLRKAVVRILRRR